MNDNKETRVNVCARVCLCYGGRDRRSKKSIRKNENKNKNHMCANALGHRNRIVWTECIWWGDSDKNSWLLIEFLMALISMNFGGESLFLLLNMFWWSNKKNRLKSWFDKISISKSVHDSNMWQSIRPAINSRAHLPTCWPRCYHCKATKNRKRIKN